MPPAQVTETVYVRDEINPDLLVCEAYPGNRPVPVPGQTTWAQSTVAIRLPETEQGWESCYCAIQALRVLKLGVPADPVCRR